MNCRSAALLRRAARPRGFALIIVLFSCVLCALTVVILMERTGANTRFTAVYQDAAEVRTLADVALQIVEAQIRDATSEGQSGLPNTRSTWASQPGAIHVFDANGSLSTLYKLYSAPSLRTSTPGLAGDLPTDWHTRPTEYVDLNEPVASTHGLHYPILHPASATLNPGGTGIAAGFSITQAPVAPPGSPNENAAPMPVRWIYVLRDGTLCQLGDARIDRSSNPIIGRVAFWTDDESTKVNLNTAAPTTANSFWDTPRAATAQEALYAWNQPAQNEYSRYPGHPASVSLRAILGSLGQLAPAGYYGVTPRYRWGGSEDGSLRIDAARTQLLTAKQDRLYASVDELLFTGTPTALQPGLNAPQVESLKFFLTTNSQSPELNLFGQPRVTIWPIHADTTDQRRTPYDRLIAFCSQIGGRDYHFTRSDPLDPTHDFTSSARNQALYAYLQHLTTGAIPGFGTPGFLQKYGDDRDQILTAIFDYIRTTNLNETFTGRDTNFRSYTPDWDISGLTTGSYSPSSPSKGAGFVVPIQIGNTRGGGRFPALSGAALWFVRHYGTDPNATPPPPQNPEMLSAALILKSTTPAHGFMPWIGSDFRFVIGAGSIQAQVGSTQQTLFVGGTSKEVYYSPLVGAFNGNSPGGYEGFAWTLGIDSTQSVQAPTPFFSLPITIPAGATTFSILSGSITVSLEVRGQVIQTYELEFPAAPDIPLPTINSLDFGGGRAPSAAWWQYRLWNSPASPLAGDVLKSIELSHGDARLALMTASSPSAPFSDYTPHPSFSTPAAFSHSMRGYASYPYLLPGGTAGSYVALPTFEAPVSFTGKVGIHTLRPDLLPSITDLRTEGWSGDFDNGVGHFPDGPFLNKPDEGTNAYTSTETPYNRALWTRANGLFSPLRQVPSPVMFGSLPSGVKAGAPWQTLLFCPNPPNPTHPGKTDPPDHLLLDLFRMPVVEPFAMSGPASTEGKINMNYAIAPFSYIRRASSWYALLENLRIMAIPDSESLRYKTGSPVNFRHPIQIAETLRQFDHRFQTGIFRSASEICELFLVPSGSTLEQVENLASGYWSTRRLTGDNTREKPYAELYPRITTQSNSYLVHLRVQALPESDGLPSGADDFQPVAEYRGSRLIERYLDLPPGVDPDTASLTPHYQHRILREQQFTP